MGDIKEGTILVAESGLQDPGFAGSVILLLVHGPSGSAGFDLTRTEPLFGRMFAEMGLSFIVDPLPEGYKDIYVGGPVENYSDVFYIHSSASGPRSSRPIGGTGFSWEILRMADQGIDVPEDFFDRTPDAAIVGLGYTGWDPGQLDMESNLGIWRVADIALADLLAARPEERWQKAMDSAGPDFGGGDLNFGNIGPYGGPGPG